MNWVVASWVLVAARYLRRARGAAQHSTSATAPDLGVEGFAAVEAGGGFVGLVH